MVAAISATDGNISLVIKFLHEANSVCLFSGDGEAIRPIQATNSHVASTPREVGVSIMSPGAWSVIGDEGRHATRAGLLLAFWTSTGSSPVTS